MTGGLTFLIAIPEVQEELAVTPQQQELLESLHADLQTQRRGLFRRRSGGARSEEIRDQFRTFREQGEKLVTTILEPSQTQRLHQLRLQHEGIAALDRNEFVQALGLSESQRDKLRDIRGLGLSRGRERSGERLSAAEWDAHRAQIMAVLSDEQKKRWEAKKGNEFRFPDRLSRFAPRGFGGGRGGDRGPRSQRP
jgi:hypothetical protein